MKLTTPEGLYPMTHEQAHSKCILGPRFEYGGECIVELSPLQRAGLSRLVTDCERGEFPQLSVSSLCGVEPGSDQATLLATRDRYGLMVNTWLSKKSGLLWTSPRMTDDSLNRFYGGHFQSIHRGSDDQLSVRYANQILRSRRAIEALSHVTNTTSMDGKVVFDIGCASGGMLELFRERGANVFGADMGGESYIKYGRTHNLSLYHGDESTLSYHGPADIIMLVHTLEHLPDPISILKRLRPLIANDGHLYIEVPGVMNMKPYGGDFLKYLQTAHLFHYSLNTLTCVAAMAGFKRVWGDDEVRAVFSPSDEIEPQWSELEADAILENLFRVERAYVKRSEQSNETSHHGIRFPLHITAKVLRKLASYLE